MQLKFIVALAGIAITGIGIIVVVSPARRVHDQVKMPESELPTTISNYSKTFKLNTNLPIWKTPTNGSHAAN